MTVEPEKEAAYGGAAGPPPLDEAWADVDAALPVGYAVMLRGSNDWMGRGPTWKADAYHSDGRRKACHVEAETPAAALIALAAALGSSRKVVVG